MPKKSLEALRKNGPPPPTPFNIAIVTSLPYIRAVLKPRKCDGWVGGPYKPSRCPRSGDFHYAAGRSRFAHAPSGTWCWYHLFMEGIWARRYDAERAERARKKILKERAQ